MGDGFASRTVELPGNAPSVLPELRLPSSEPDTGAVPIGDAALGIRRVDRCGKLIQNEVAVGTGERIQGRVEDLFGMISGQLRTRISSTSFVSLSRGDVGLVSGSHYDTSGASTSISFGLTRHFQAFAQYAYYRNRIPAGLTTLAAVTNFAQQTASVGLSFYQPIFHSARK